MTESLLILGLALTALPVFGTVAKAPSPAPDAGAEEDRQVLVEFFYQGGCDECIEVEEEVFPQIVDMFGNLTVFKRYDIQKRTNYYRLAVLQDRLDVTANEKVSVFIDETIYLGGIAAIRDGLHLAIDSRLEQPVSPTGFEPATRSANPAITESPEQRDSVKTDGIAVLKDRMSWFDPLLVAAAGLFDGLNPCAFATMIFFVSMVSVSGRRRRDMLIVGAGFCATVFFTYLALGFGVFNAIRAMPLRESLAGILRWSVAGVLCVLALLSFRDAAVYHRTGKPGDIKLKLPEVVSSTIRNILRRNLGSGGMFVGSIIAGFLVTLLESICTGQLYLPTLVYLTSMPHVRTRAWALLVLYCAMFVLPLLVILAAAYAGAGSHRLASWTRTNVVPGKIMLGVIFLILAVLMIMV